VEAVVEAVVEMEAETTVDYPLLITHQSFQNANTYL
jgi:hypothetical protein